MKYAAEMGSGTMIHIPSFITIRLSFQKLMGGYIDTQTDDRINLLSFFKIRKIS
jgi:hypothetical protein